MTASTPLTSILRHRPWASRCLPLKLESGFSMLETIVVVGLIGVISAIAMPMIGNAIANFRLTGDARSVSNAIALAKMRAASNFTRVRLYVDLSARSHHLEVLDKTTVPNHWTIVGGSTSLSTNVLFGYGVVSSPPLNTQPSIDQAPQCTDDDGVVIANTSCVMFNSRGVPIIANGAPTNLDALYVTDGSAVCAVTVSGTGMLRVWRTPPVSTPSWMSQ
jgi:prepilin-type N-terminal cleavage/methylation domain-containing protein